MSGRKPKVLLAMSGGVDSSVAAALLLREGYEVVGVFMRLGSPGETFDELMPLHAESDDQREEDPDRCRIRIGHQGCCSINDAADARFVAAKLGIPFYVVNFKKDFGRVIDYFVDEYNAGRTPNPCIRCNDWLKFGRLHDYALQIDAEFVASGHYARIARATGPTASTPWAFPRLLRGVDHDKDQSYVLFGMPRERLAHMLLPIGGYRKSQVRAIAAELDLPVFDKPDSQEICFVPDNDYAGLVRRRTPQSMQRGEILDRAGNVIGAHDGHQHFTIGQRRGLGVAVGHPLYVIDKDAAGNTITVGGKSDLASAGCRACDANWLIEAPQRAGTSSGRNGGGSEWIACSAKIRYNADPVPARVRPVDGEAIEVRFDQPQLAVAPGQAVVCYDDSDAVICGGWIDATLI
jgi:tRNA-specific 2-thiouridylase